LLIVGNADAPAVVVVAVAAVVAIVVGRGDVVAVVVRRGTAWLTVVFLGRGDTAASIAVGMAGPTRRAARSAITL